MSHFTVLVIGDDPEKQLAPYHEFECTGENDEYVQDVDITAEVQEQIAKDGMLEGLSYYGLEGKVVPSEAFVDRSDTHKYGYAVVKDDKLVKAIDRTNPNKKWDWYVLGGRWTGYLTLKPGCKGEIGKPGLMTEAAEHGKVDAARKRDIDFTAIRDEAERKARARYRRFFSLLEDRPLPKSWHAIRAEHEGDIDAACEAYRTQPGIQAIQKDDELRWADDPGAEFGCTEDRHAERARERTISTFAVVKDSKWFEKGSMGWWGCVADEKDQDAWNREFSKLLDSVSGDTLLSVYDCHI